MMPAIPFIDRVVLKPDTSCWVWTGTTNGRGYGRVWSVGKQKKAHRVFYELLVGDIPEDLELDHLCFNKLCVNPAHLEPVTHQENLRRAGITGLLGPELKTHCPRKHPYTPENTISQLVAGTTWVRRMCRICRKVSQGASLVRRTMKRRRERLTKEENRP